MRNIEMTESEKKLITNKYLSFKYFECIKNVFDIKDLLIKEVVNEYGTKKYYLTTK